MTIKQAILHRANCAQKVLIKFETHGLHKGFPGLLTQERTYWQHGTILI